MPQSFVCMASHIIFSTKDREPLLLPDVAPRVHSYIGGICRDLGCSLLAAGGMPDHVHLLVSLGKQNTISDLIRDVKSNSSGWIHKTLENLRGFAWQRGYGAFAVSYSNVADVRRYIAQQAEHHRVRTFQEEFLAFLERHHIVYDPRYVWD